MNMIQLGMSSILLFQDKYYEYAGEEDLNKKGLTIGEYESAWLSDTVGAFILENTR